MGKNGGPVRVCDSGWDRAGPVLRRVDTTQHTAFAQLEASAIWRIFHSKGPGEKRKESSVLLGSVRPFAMVGRIIAAKGTLYLHVGDIERITHNM